MRQSRRLDHYFHNCALCGGKSEPEMMFEEIGDSFNDCKIRAQCIYCNAATVAHSRWIDCVIDWNNGAIYPAEKIIEPKVDMKSHKAHIQTTLKGIKNFMFSMFWAGNQEANLDELEERVYRLIRATTQKSGGGREAAKDIKWDTLDVDLLAIAMEATALVLDARFPELKRAWNTPEMEEVKPDDGQT